MRYFERLKDRALAKSSAASVPRTYPRRLAGFSIVGRKSCSGLGCSFAVFLIAAGPRIFHARSFSIFHLFCAEILGVDLLNLKPCCLAMRYGALTRTDGR